VRPLYTAKRSRGGQDRKQKGKKEETRDPDDEFWSF
jgi:hypothetical protein